MNNPSVVFLDASTLDLGDIDLSPLYKKARLVCYSDTKSFQVITRLKQADIAIINKIVLKEKELKQLPQLKLISVAATGVNNVDLDYCAKNKIAVTNVAGYSTTTVAEHALMMMLATSHRLVEHRDSTLAKKWSRSPHFALLDYPFRDLRGKTLGIIGYGNIGKEVSRLARAFGMTVLASQIPGRSTKGRVSFKTVLKKSDFISLHCPLSRHTHHLINKTSLKMMKKDCVLLNLARGPVVNEPDVAQALKQNRLACYATDVMQQEPPSANNPLFDKKIRNKVLITPHVAWASLESRQRLTDEMGKNIEAFLKGKKRNRLI
ncbi:D-2-hydroxyacid dehydrogenase [bacterium]|nr:D-2-hydroxyacid dehydrogenase [bacterium]